MKSKKIIGLVGEQAGGKGTAANIIIKHFGGVRLTTSNILRRTLDDIYVESSRDNLINLALLLKKGFGEDVLMKAMLNDVEKQEAELIIVDGIRMPGDTEPFRKIYGNDFKLIYVTAPQKLRYERSVGRGEKAGESTATFEEFASKEKLKTERYIKKVGKTADFRINNTGDAASLERKVKKAMKEI